MPLVDIPLTGGLQQRTSEFNVPQGSLLVAQNCRQDKNGALSKRPGTTTIQTGNFGLTGANFRGMVCRGETLTCFSGPTFINGSGTAVRVAGSTAESNTLTTCEAQITRRVLECGYNNNFPSIASPAPGFQEPAVAVSNGVIATVQLIDGLVYLSIHDAVTDTVLFPLQKVNFTPATLAYCTVTFAGTTIIILARDSGAANIRAMKWPATAGYTGSGPFGETILRTDAENTFPTYNFDACPAGTSNFCLGYVTAAGLGLYTYDTSFTQQQTAAVGTPSPKSIAITAGVGGIAVAWVNAGLTGALLAVYSTTLSSLLGGSGTATVATGQTAVYAALPGWVDSNTVAVAIGFGASAAVNRPIVAMTLVTVSTAAVFNFFGANWSFIAGRPFAFNGVVYAYVRESADVAGNSATYTRNYVLSLVCFIDRARVVGSDMPRYAVRGQEIIVAPSSNGQWSPFSTFQMPNGAWGSVAGFLISGTVAGYAAVIADFASGGTYIPAECGGNMYLPGTPAVFDGSRCAEVGFTQPIIDINLAIQTGSALSIGTYYYQACYVFVDAAGNITRGALSPPQPIVTTAGNQKVLVTLPTLNLGGRLPNGLSNYGRVTIEIYRSSVNPAVSGGVVETHLLASIVNPASGLTVTYTDTLGDGAIAGNPFAYTFSGAFNNQSPPSFISIASWKTHLFGIAPDQKTLYWTKAYAAGEASSFCDQFTIQVDDAGRLTALRGMDDKLIIFSDKRIYYLVGDGPSDNGLSNDYGFINPINTDIGCIDPRSIVEVPDGLMFQSRVGIYLLDRGLGVTYIGQPVVDELATYPVVTAALLHPSQPWVYFAVQAADGSAGKRLVYDYRLQQWYTDVFSDPVKLMARTVMGKIYLFTNGGSLLQEDTTSTVYLDSGAWIPMKFETAWNPTQPGKLGWANLDRLQLIATKKSPCDAVLSLRENYQTAVSQSVIYFDTLNQPKTPTIEVELANATGKQESFTVVYQDFAPTSGATTTGQGWTVQGLTFQVSAVSDELNKLAPVQRGKSIT